MERHGRRASGAIGGRVSLMVAWGVAVSMGLTACAQPHGPDQGPSPNGRPAPVAIEVDNQAFHDVDIYTLIDGMRSRLGTVTGHETGHFTIPWTPRDVGMQVHVIGGGTYDTDTMPVHPGDRLRVVVMPGLQPHINLVGQG